MFLGLLSCIGLQMFAQVSVSGKVVDAGGIEMPGVNIAIKGTMVGTMTGADGTFTLSSIPGGKDAVLVFSFIGFRSQEVKVGNQTFINVKLEEDTEQLEEVVVIGYGTARKKDLSGAISNVQMTDELAALPNPNVMGSLSSKVAGFRYSPTNSAGGDNFSSLNIRGKNAIPADVSAGQQSVNQPLLIVDGVISFGSINEINTNDIQSVDVLKDASAAAIYGSRAANGVIIITTKRGLSERPVINVNSSWNFSGWSRMPKMVTDEEKFFRNRFYAKQASGSIPSDAVWSSDFDRAQLMNTVEYDAYNEGVYTDWLDEISRTGFGQKYDVSVSGRSKIVNYYISGDYTRQKGIRKGDDYEKYNIMTKLDIQAKEWLKIGLKGNYLGAKEWGVPARIQNATWMTPYSYTHARQPGYENWPNSRPDGNSASPFWGSGAGDSHLWTDDQKRNYNINGVAYAQKSVVSFTPCATEENSFNYELQRPISEQLYELFRPFGYLNFDMGNTRLGEVFVLDKREQIVLKLQGRIGTTNLRVTILKTEIAGAKDLKTAEERIKCQLTKYQMCMGCLACESVCRFNALSIRENKDGEIEYHISDEQCKRCGECVNHFTAGCYMRKVLAIKRQRTEDKE